MQKGEEACSLVLIDGYNRTGQQFMNSYAAEEREMRQKPSRWS